MEPTAKKKPARRQARRQLRQVGRIEHCKSNFSSVLSTLKSMPKGLSYLTGELIILHFHFFIICNQNFKRIYLKTIFLNLVDRFDRIGFLRDVGFFKIVQFLSPKKPCLKIR